MKINPDFIYAEDIKLIVKTQTTLENMEAKFINAIHHHIQTLELRGLDIFIESQTFGGWFSQKSRVLFIHAKKSKLKKLSSAFFITQNGNAYSLRLYEMMHSNYIEKFKDKIQTQRVDFLKSSFESLEERQDYTMFRELNKMLFSIGTDSFTS